MLNINDYSLTPIRPRTGVLEAFLLKNVDALYISNTFEPGLIYLFENV